MICLVCGEYILILKATYDTRQNCCLCRVIRLLFRTNLNKQNTNNTHKLNHYTKLKHYEGQSKITESCQISHKL